MLQFRKWIKLRLARLRDEKTSLTKDQTVSGTDRINQDYFKNQINILNTNRNHETW